MEKEVLDEGEDARIRKMGVTKTSVGMQATVNPIMNSRFDGRTSKTTFERVKSG
jgi:hypothetical protein